MRRTLGRQGEAGVGGLGLARDAVGSLGLRAASLGLGLAGHLLLTRALGARGYGVYAYALSWVMALSVPAMLGLDRLVVREVALYRARSDWGLWHGLLLWADRTLLAVSLGLALLAIIVSWLVAGNAPGLWAFWLAMALLPLTALMRLKQAVIQGMHRTVAGQLPELLVHPLLLLILAAAAYAALGEGMTAAWAVAMNAAATLAALILGMALVGRHLPPTVKESAPGGQARIWMQSALPLVCVSGAYAVSSQIPVLMLGAVEGTEAAGILNVAKRLADLTIFPSLALSMVLAPAVVGLWAARDVQGLQQTLTKCARGATLASLPLALVLILSGDWFLQLFGAQFRGGSTALAILSVGHLVNTLTGSVGLLLVMTGHEREVAVVSTACTLLNLVLCAATIPFWGATAAAVSAAVSLIIWNLWLAWHTWRLLGIRPGVFGLRRRGAVA